MKRFSIPECDAPYRPSSVAVAPLPILLCASVPLCEALRFRPDSHPMLQALNATAAEATEGMRLGPGQGLVWLFAAHALLQ